MTNVAHTVRTIWTGNISGVQSWSFGFAARYFEVGTGGTGGIPSSDVVAAGLAASSDLAGYESDFWSALGTLVSPIVHWTGVTYNVYGEDPTTPTSSERTVGGGGGGGSVRVPPETAIVASLRTALGNRSGRGRMYLPLLGADPDAGGLLSATYQGQIASAVAAYFHSINTHDFAGGAGYELQVGVLSTTHGYINDVTSVVVDSHYDAQRRREDKLALTRTIVAVS